MSDYFTDMLNSYNIKSPNPTGEEVFNFDTDLFLKYSNYIETTEKYIEYLLPESHKDLILNVYLIPGEVLSDRSIAGVTKSKMSLGYDSESFVLCPFGNNNSINENCIFKILMTICHESIHQAINKSKERQKIIALKVFLEIEEYIVESIIKSSKAGIIHSNFGLDVYPDTFGIKNEHNKKLKDIYNYLFLKIQKDNIKFFPKLDIDLFLSILNIIK